MRLKFFPKDGLAPERCVHYGYDFANGAVCDVQDKHAVSKLLATGYFFEVKQDRQEPEKAQQQFHDSNRAMKRKKRATHGNDHQS